MDDKEAIAKAQKAHRDRREEETDKDKVAREGRRVAKRVTEIKGNGKKSK